MSVAHECQLPLKYTSGLPKLPPNASFSKRLVRKFRKLIIVNPKNFKCNSLFSNKSIIMAEQRRHIKSPYFFMIHPLSTLNSFLEIMFLVLWLSKMVVEPVMGNMMQKPEILELITYYPVIALQRAIILSFFFVGYMDPISKEIVIESRRVAKRYITTYFFIDLFGSELPGITSLALKWIYTEHMVGVRQVIKLVERVHIIFLYARLKTILTFLDDIGQMMKIRKKYRKCLTYLFKTFMYLHVCCCALYYIPQIVYNSDWPSDSWLVVAKISPKQEHEFFRKYGECLLTTASYFFGTSAGRYDIYQTNEQICMAIISLFGRIYTLFLLADALNTFGIPTMSESRYERTLSELREYMLSKNFPRILKNRMIRYYECKMQKRYFNETEILSSLSEALRAEIYLFSARMLMQKSTFFKYLPQREIATLIAKMNLVTYAPGDVLFTADKGADDVFFISSGSIAMMTVEGHELCHLEDGEAFGLCRTLACVKHMSAVAVEVTDVFLIDTHVLYHFLEGYPEAVKYLLSLANEKQVLYKRLEHIATGKGSSCQSELRAGKLLEKRRKRVFVE